MKTFRVAIFVLLLIALSFGIYYYQNFTPATQTNFGLTFSTRYAAYLGFDPKQMYLDILSDLKPKKLRLIAYWEDIEPQRGKFDFQQMDEMLAESDKEKIDVILDLGLKQPRWPECHQPAWYNDLNQEQQKQAILSMLQASVTHFKKFSSIKTWQIENEPYFVFGLSCPAMDPGQVQNEIKLVKENDSRPVIITDSGERGNWVRTAQYADELGVTMYRTVYSSWFGYYHYPIPAWFYRLKAGYFKTFENKPIVGIELQAEPWFIKAIADTDLDTQKTLMNPKVFETNIEYARKAGIGDNYLWGAEWWYWMAKHNGDWGMWAAAKKLLSN